MNTPAAFAEIERLMALVDTYADTACVNGIRSGWATMARGSVQQALLDNNAAHRSATIPACQEAPAASAELN